MGRSYFMKGREKCISRRRCHMQRHWGRTELTCFKNWRKSGVTGAQWVENKAQWRAGPWGLMGHVGEFGFQVRRLLKGEWCRVFMSKEDCPGSCVDNGLTWGKGEGRETWEKAVAVIPTGGAGGRGWWWQWRQGEVGRLELQEAAALGGVVGGAFDVGTDSCTHISQCWVGKTNQLFQMEGIYPKEIRLSVRKFSQRSSTSSTFQY